MGAAMRRTLDEGELAKAYFGEEEHTSGVRKVAPPTAFDEGIASRVKRLETGKVMKPRAARTRERAQEEMRELWRDGRVSELLPVHLVEVFAIGHRRLYKIDSTDLDSPSERVKAIGAAKRFVEREFAGNVTKVVEFIKWSWKNAAERAAWADRKGIQLNRMNWQIQFSSKLVVDWRVAILNGAKLSDRPPPPAPPPHGSKS